MNFSMESEPAALSIPTNVRAFGLFIRCLIYYCVVSTLTLPFINHLWLGELPLLAIIQRPKVSFAAWMRTEVVMEAIKWLGVSNGSFSPDYRMARPYALALAYLLPLMMIALLSMRFRSPLEMQKLALVLLAVSTIDYLATLQFAAARSLTIY
jgi:hypothetical protein